MKIANKILILTAVMVSLFFFSKNYFVDNSFKKNRATELLKKLSGKKKNVYSPKKTDKPDLFTKYFNRITTHINSNKSTYKINYKVSELRSANKKKTFTRFKNQLQWIDRGPNNVTGRIRALIVDPDDETDNTWFVGAASGGVWKTSNGGTSWDFLSDDFTNLSVNALAISESNANVLYAGTGESFPGGSGVKGNGIWKTTDKGRTWSQLRSTIIEDFTFVNRLIIDPQNESVVIAATETGIFKSSDGGDNWIQVYKSIYGVEDLVADPFDFNIQYAGEHYVGIVKSVDGGASWKHSLNGMTNGSRFEIAVSPVNSSNVFVSANVSDEESYVYMSNDRGTTWAKFNDDQAFLGAQGDYDNAIAAHPFNEDEIYVGGVDIWKIKFNGTTINSEPTVKNAYIQDVSFLEFVNFGGNFLNGGMSNSEEAVELQESDWASVEIRFGPGLSQKAHRFIVPEKSTSGVPAEDYSFVDYVDVPFQVWDVTNNKQLMVSFRDQEIDGEFNLYERTGEGYGLTGREYIFVNSVEYNEGDPDENISKAGGHMYKNLYMFWTVLAEGEIWNPENLPESKIVVDYGSLLLKNGVKTSIADSYDSYSGGNSYNQSEGFGQTSIPGLHPDHHKFILLPVDASRFKFLDANDGGIGISEDNGATFKMLTNSLVSTQFYGVAKNPFSDEYIGGMQDNGTWQSPIEGTSNDIKNFIFRIGGDGFECLWHSKKSDLLLGSIYNNSIYKSANGGDSWVKKTTGIDDSDGPFITRLSSSKDNPFLVFAVGNSGVYRSKNFGTSWEKIQITPKWSSGEVTSAHNVEVSLANGNIVWAGGAMAPKNEMSIHVSVNEGLTFNAVNNFTDVEMEAYISGIATHPMLDSTAYILFSLQGKPKVIRTTDLGNSWEDISGFGTSTASSNGFPDVVVHSLIVMPHNPEVIWVGTDIGLFESINNGESWHIANNGLPPVSVYDMQIVGHQVVVATHGRGIWTVDIPEIDNSPYIDDFTHVQGFKLNINTNIKVAYDSVQVLIDGKYHSSVKNPAVGVTDIPVEVADNGKYLAQIVAYIGEQPYKSNKIDVTFDVTSFDELGNKISTKLANIYPNPCNGKFSVNMTQEVEGKAFVQVYGLNGALIHIQEINSGNTNVKLEGVNKGTYIVKIHSKSINETHKLIIK